MPRKQLEQADQPDLFGDSHAAGIDGWRYQPDFLAVDEEAQLLQVVQALPLAEMRYKQYTARRRGIGFGGHYDFDANRLHPAPELPPVLHPLRARVAAWLGVEPQALTHALVAEYTPGTPLGWHRDVPDFEAVAGVSLLSDAVLEFRPWRPGSVDRSAERLRYLVERRSIYALRGAARWDWQHCVPAVASLRYSLTFRTAADRRVPR